jgi:hypothetical protein
MQGMIYFEDWCAQLYQTEIATAAPLVIVVVALTVTVVAALLFLLQLLLQLTSVP